ncbi:MAG: hypothetical protein GSR85_02340 [Desulfurococcales archaeon]|nr:hypothetical protein [Desulfurococcales archaeon]
MYKHPDVIWVVSIIIALALIASLASGPGTGIREDGDLLGVLSKSSYAAMQYAGMIELPKLGAMRESWGSTYILTHDFNLQGLQGWEGRLGSYELTSIPQNLETKYQLPLFPEDSDGPYDAGAALLLHAEQSAVVLVKTWSIDPGSLEYVRMISYALATRTDCTGNVSVHAGFYYVAESMGAIATTGGLDYDKILPHIIANGTNWILTKPTGVVEIYSPTENGEIRVNGVSAYKAPKGTYIVGGEPYRVTGEPVGAVVKQANGGFHTTPAQALDGLPTAIVPGNPLLITPRGQVEGALLLDLAPGYSRLPARLELYKLVGDGWVLVDSTSIVPADGRVGFLVEAGPGDVFMLKSTVTVRVDRLYFSPVEKLDLRGLESIGGVGVTRSPWGVRVEYDPEGYGGLVLLRIDAGVGGGSVLYTGGGGLTVYGRLWITNPSGAPYIDGCEWVAVSSDVVEVPGGVGISESGVVLIGYRYSGGPDSPLMALYVKTLLYPIIASGGYPDNKYDITYHTEAVVGIKHANYMPTPSDPRYDEYRVDVEVVALRTSIAGENYWGGPLDVPDINITFGDIEYEDTGGCEPLNYGSISHGIGGSSVESTNPDKPRVISGLATVLSAINVLGSFTPTILTVSSYDVQATIINATSSAPGLFSEVVDVMYGATKYKFLQKTKLIDLPCTYFSGFSIMTEYGVFDDYTHVVMGYEVSYSIVAPSQYGVLISAFVFNHYEYNDYRATDDDAIVVLLYFIKPVKST